MQQFCHCECTALCKSVFNRWRSLPIQTRYKPKVLPTLANEAMTMEWIDGPHKHNQVCTVPATDGFGFPYFNAHFMSKELHKSKKYASCE